MTELVKLQPSYLQSLSEVHCEDIKHIDENGVEFWSAREMFPLFGYSTWQAFDDVVARAIKSAVNAGQIAENHFSQLTKMVEIGSNTKRQVKDWKLDRYACYLIAQNGDPKISQIALAQTYFAIQTRKSENKKLFKTAKQAGVSNFGLFNDAGYKGLYGASLSEVEAKKGIKKGELLDRASSTELAANLFRITQTDEKLKKDNVKTEYDAKTVGLSKAPVTLPTSRADTLVLSYQCISEVGLWGDGIC
jgi:DNA-damage-inducible protein D